MPGVDDAVARAEGDAAAVADEVLFSKVVGNNNSNNSIIIEY